MSTIKLIIADDNELIQVGLKAVLLEKIPNLELHVSESAEDLMTKVKNTSAQVVLIDYTAEKFSLSAIAEIKESHPEVKFIGFTFLQSSTIIVNAIKSGIDSYIKKDCDIQEITDAVVETAKGNMFFCGTILEKLREDAVNVGEIEFDPLSCAPVNLSKREQEIITLIAEGYTNGQVAEKLFLSSHTITTHRKNIMNKLGVNNTAGIVMYAVKSNLVSPNKYLFSAEV